MRVEQLALLAARATSAATPPSRTRVDAAPLEVVEVGDCSSAAGVDASAARAARARVPAMCSRSHGTPPNWSACVVSCSATQRSSCVGVGVQRARRRGRGSGATNSSRARRPRARARGNSYWPSTRPARKPEIAPDLGAPAATPAAAPTTPLSGPSPSPSLVGDRVEHAAHRARGWPRPTRRGRRPRRAAAAPAGTRPV